MAGHPEELPALGGVAALLGAPPWIELGAGGACRVVSGAGLVAKVGPVELIAREAAMLARPLPLSAPVLVDTGPGWLVMTAEADDDRPWTDDELAAALRDLARLHDAGLDGRRSSGDAGLRRPFSEAGADELLEPVRRLGYPLPGPLARVLVDPGVLLAAAAEDQATVLHGDPWPGNVLRPAPGRRVWIDWELAGFGPAAADVATWLDQAPWHAGVEAGAAGTAERWVELYLSARSAPIDRRRFERALHAAEVLWFLAYDVPRLADGTAPAEFAGRMVDGALRALARLEDG